ncbi:hypothetical protein ANN_18430 [Periplaneta americana]|uniref:Mariner Mos1 transposase n=1 Tax=Periplaneta americana TaxID=6978 RepID=A0ABQ8SPY1_PERAM|nr:hypothetical protein ANN_18430 [Periplaneta americana]
MGLILRHDHSKGISLLKLVEHGKQYTGKSAGMQGKEKCERPKIMFTKLEQRSWIKIEVARGHSAQACGDAELPYRTVERWVKAFREGLVGSAVKMMFIVAYDIDGVILHHAVPPRQTVNADYYCRFLQHHLRPALRRKRRHLGVQNPIILHDNAKSHTAAAVKDLLRRWQWEILEHPPYSPDMIHAITIFSPNRTSHGNEVDLGMTCGETTSDKMDPCSHDVGPLRRKERTGKTTAQMV